MALVLFPLWRAVPLALTLLGGLLFLRRRQGDDIDDIYDDHKTSPMPPVKMHWRVNYRRLMTVIPASRLICSEWWF